MKSCVTSRDVRSVLPGVALHVAAIVLALLLSAYQAHGFSGAKSVDSGELSWRGSRLAGIRELRDIKHTESAFGQAPLLTNGVTYSETVRSPVDARRLRTGSQHAATEIRRPMHIVRGQPAPAFADGGLTKEGAQHAGEKRIPQPGDPRQPEPLEQKALSRATSGVDAPDGWTLIMEETFEGAFPTGIWQVFDSDGATNGEYYWDDDNLMAHAGGWSAWPASAGADGVDPEFFYYPNGALSWMTFGPFDLSDANYADMLFHYWNQSEENFDFLFWGASLDGVDFYGDSVSGDSGGWIEEAFLLTDVYELGDLTGQSQVWIAFVFVSDYSVVDIGPFVDDISLWKFFPSEPNLTPYAPPDWPYPIVPSAQPGTHAVDDIPVNAPTYIDWAVTNYGADIEGLFDICVYFDEQELACWTINSLNYNWHVYLEDWQPDIDPSPGTHTLTIVADIYNEIMESDEEDNVWSREFDWGDLDCSLMEGQRCQVFLSTVLAPMEPMPQLSNGNFEQGPNVGWVQLVNSTTGRLIYNRNDADIIPHSGDWYAWLGGMRNQTNQLRQRLQFALPAGYETKLQYWFWIVSTEDACNNDWAEVRVSSSSTPGAGDALLRVNLCRSNNTAPPGSTNGWRLRSPVSLDAFRGRTVTIEFFTSLNAGDLNSNFFIDDIFLCNDQPNAVGPRCQSPVVASSRLGAETRGGSDSEVIGETFGTIEKGEIIVP